MFSTNLSEASDFNLIRYELLVCSSIFSVFIELFIKSDAFWKTICDRKLTYTL